MKEKSSDFKEIYVPEKKGLLKKAKQFFGSGKKPRYKFDITPEIPSSRTNEPYDETYDVDAGYFNPFEEHGKDELRKKKSAKSKTKRKPAKKCKCK